MPYSNTENTACPILNTVSLLSLTMSKLVRIRESQKSKKGGMTFLLIGEVEE